jgi:serine protease Do
MNVATAALHNLRRFPKVASLLKSTFLWAGILGMMLFGISSVICRAEDDLDSLEAAAFTAAVDHVAPSIVRIETVGGVDHVGTMLLGTGPTTGVIMSPDGYIVSSAFNFIGRPTSILVALPDGSHKPAKLVATDRSRMIVLLKIEAGGSLPICEIATPSEMRVGQWTIAVGRAFDSNRPSMSVGILSAVNRIWGKAIQTDAAVSPNNYGGPLIDIHGRLLGILVPLSPETADEMAGAEWYDSGIGFAIPAEHIQQTLERMKQGGDLNPGMSGISIAGPNLYTGEPIIAACRKGGPADAAGIRAGDRIVEIDGRKIHRAAEVREAIGRRYSGETMHVVVMRDNAAQAFDINLIAKLAPYQHGFLGILPMRDVASSSDAKKGVVVRYVYPESPAAKAGIVHGNLLITLDGEEIPNRLTLRDQIGSHEPGEEIELEVQHDGSTRQVKIALTGLPEPLPPKDLPPSHGKIAIDAAKQRGPTGAMPLKIAEFSNEAWAYVPPTCQENVPHGVLLWMHGPDPFDWNALLGICKPLCDRYDLILIAPKANDPQKWTPGELPCAVRLLGEIIDKYPIDATRIVVGGQETGGTLAFAAAFRNHEIIRAVAAIDAPTTGNPPENEPPYRLAVLEAIAKKSQSARAVESSLDEMRKLKIPTTMLNLGETPRTFTTDEWAELIRWIDMLDRI